MCLILLAWRVPGRQPLDFWIAADANPLKKIAAANAAWLVGCERLWPG